MGLTLGLQKLNGMDTNICQWIYSGLRPSKFCRLVLAPASSNVDTMPGVRVFNFFPDQCLPQGLEPVKIEKP